MFGVNNLLIPHSLPFTKWSLKTCVELLVVLQSVMSFPF
jgi:hypothetical protein